MSDTRAAYQPLGEHNAIVISQEARVTFRVAYSRAEVIDMLVDSDAPNGDPRRFQRMPDASLALLLVVRANDHVRTLYDTLVHDAGEYDPDSFDSDNWRVTEASEQSP